ncbi:MAG: DUF4157 domain-containing protein [Acetobacteraceae bacterium]|jgi:hypothetical protein
MIAPAIARAETKTSAADAAGPQQQQRVASRQPVSGLGNQALLRRRAKSGAPEGVIPAGIAPDSVHHALGTTGQPLDPAARAFLAPRFGRDFADVRVHTGAQAARSARDVGAAAYTVGADIVFGEGAHAPATTDGLRLIAHELAHVAQSDGERDDQRRLRRQTLILRNGHQLGVALPLPTNNTKEDAVDALTRLWHLWAIDNDGYKNTVQTLWAHYGPGDVISDNDLVPLKNAITKAEQPDIANAVANTMLGLKLPEQPAGRGIGQGLTNDADDIKAVQNRLMALGLLAATTASGTLDADTKAALTAFKHRIAAGTLGIAADRPNELDAGLDKYGGQTVGVRGDSITLTPPATEKQPSPAPMTFNKPLVAFVPRNAPPDKNKVSVFFTPADNPTSFVSQQGLRSQYDNSEWILIAVPGVEEGWSPNWVTLSTAEIQQCLTALKRPNTKIDALRLVAHSRGARGLEHSIGKGGAATVDVSLVERVTVFDASYQDLGNAVRADKATMPAATAPGGMQLYDTTVANVSGFKGTQFDVSSARALFYVRFVQDGLALHKIDPVDIRNLRSDAVKNVRDATNRLLAALPPRGTFSSKDPAPAGQTSLKAFFAAHQADLALVDDRVDGLSPLVAPASPADPGLDLGFKFDLNKMDPNRTLSAHHWLASELAHEAVE